MNHDAVDSFVREARAFCSFVESASKLSLAERLDTARWHLIHLYTAALSLPSVEPDDSDAGPSREVPKSWPGFEGKDSYWEVFDPYQLDEPVGGSLTDDLLDVYRDVQGGLVLWDASQHPNAIWEWRFHFNVHWGDHAIDALRALHRACKWDICSP